MKTFDSIPALILALGLALTFVGHAQAAPGKGGACSEDRQRLCPDAGRGEVRECLARNQDQLSEACAERMARKAERREAFRADCGEDLAALCSGLEPGKGAIRQCLVDNLDQLSDTCHARISEKIDKRAAFEAACGDDLTQLCGDRAGGKRKAMRCLFEQSDSLSDTCLVKLDEIRAKRMR